MMSHLKDRRKFLHTAFWGGLSASFTLDQMLGLGFYGRQLASLINNSPFLRTPDSFPLMRDALRGGMSLLKVHEAMAQGDSGEWSVVTIKVVNHVCTPLVFRLGPVIGETNTTSQGGGALNIRENTRTIEGGKPCGDRLVADGVNELSDMGRYRQLRLNRWFANMLHHGTTDGQAPADGGENRLVPSEYTDTFPEDSEVAIQAGLHLTQGVDGNHSIANMKLADGMPDLCKYLMDQGLVYSPLGITCFNMGSEYDKAEGATPTNIVCAGRDEEAAVVGRTVKSYVDNISQSVNGLGYSILETNVSQNLTYSLDKLVSSDPKLRKELLASRVAFLSAIAKLEEAKTMEDITLAENVRTFDPSMGNIQTNMSGAGKEFLSACVYVANAMDIEGTPVRNFSLFLNMIDLDTNPLDFNRANGGNENVIRALSYVEGMRQLAIGLNILAKKIRQGKKLIVQVISEGGRSNQLADSKNSFSFILGPGTAGNLRDALYASSDIDIAESEAVVDPAKASAAKPWVGSDLKNADGSAVSGADLKAPSVANFQMGVAEFLAEKKGMSQAIRNTGLRYVRLRR